MTPKVVRHHKALFWREMPEFMRFLRSRESVSARALEFLILTASRSQEVRNATWFEIDLQRTLWIVPADRMKAGREHLVPLSTAAISLLCTKLKRAKPRHRLSF